jgi:hypothetical protein
MVDDDDDDDGWQVFRRGKVAKKKNGFSNG